MEDEERRNVPSAGDVSHRRQRAVACDGISERPYCICRPRSLSVLICIGTSKYRRRRHAALDDRQRQPFSLQVAAVCANRGRQACALNGP
jgi:hypothetical protein